MKHNAHTRILVQLSLLAAIELVMAYTPLGYLRTPGLEISFLMVPVTLGGILMGPAAGAALGAVFGLTSFGSCFGSSTFGAALLAIRPAFTILVCVPTRILAGWLSGLLFKALAARREKPELWRFGAAALAGPVLNTLLFTGALVALFYQTEYIQNLAQTLGAANPITFIALFVGAQGLLEAVVGCAVGTAVGRAVYQYLHR